MRNLIALCVVALLLAGCETNGPTSGTGNWQRIVNNGIAFDWRPGSGDHWIDLSNPNSFNIKITGVATNNNTTATGPDYLSDYQPGAFTVMLHPGEQTLIGTDGSGQNQFHLSGLTVLAGTDYEALAAGR
jgi:hypothetical protein